MNNILIVRTDRLGDVLHDPRFDGPAPVVSARQNIVARAPLHGAAPRA